MKRLSLGAAAVLAAIGFFPATESAVLAEDAAKPAETSVQQKAVGSAEVPKPSGEAEKPAGEAGTKELKKEPGPEAPVVVVNGKPIPRHEYLRALKAQMQAFKQASGPMHGKVDDPPTKLKEDVLEQLIDRELLYQESQKFPVDDLQGKVDAEVKGIQSRFPDTATFQEALKAQDMTEAQLKDLVGRQVSVRNYVEKQVEPAVVVPDEEVKKFYEDNKARFVTPEQVRASHLLLRYPEGSKPEDDAYKTTKSKAEDLRKKAAAGEDFAKMCRESSEDPGSKDQGGDLGFFTKDRMVEPFASVAFALKINEVSDVVETRFGFHLIKLAEKKDAVQAGFDEVKDDIAAYLKGQALDRTLQAKIKELKATAKVDVVGPHL